LSRVEISFYPPKHYYVNEIVEIKISPIRLAFSVRVFNGNKIEEKVKNGKLDLFVRVYRKTEILIFSLIPLKLIKFEIPYHEDYTDDNSNGFPDVLELDYSDSINFRNWFLEISKSQFAKKSNLWKDRDCSGLIRFAYKEALKKHDENWEKNSDFVHHSSIQKPDVKKYNYPDIPLIGTKIFKILDFEFGVFADAYHLLKYNVDFVSKDYKKAKSGDILFFYHPSSVDMPYHSMIYTGDGLLYHTGPIEDKEGELRYLKLEDVLKNFPLDWQPLPSNNKFLGFFKFKILSY
jgi:hypothetical protein